LAAAVPRRLSRLARALGAAPAAPLLVCLSAAPGCACFEFAVLRD
jgi:hypothetical protein